MKIVGILLLDLCIAWFVPLSGQTTVAPSTNSKVQFAGNSGKTCNGCKRWLRDRDGIRFAADFASVSSTCGVSEAIAALPPTGGKIILQQGNCSASGWPVTIQKPVVIEGQGMGGTTDPGTNASIVAGSSLTNTSTGKGFFVISLSGNSLEGVTFRDFALIGNKAVRGATAGDCVDIQGGTTSQQIRAIRFDNIHCNQPKGSGFVIKDNAFMITFTNVHVNQSGSHCYVLQNGPNSGVNSQIKFIASTADLCGGSNASSSPGSADGWNISGANSRNLEFIGSTAADSNNGINVVAGAVNTAIHVTHGDFETNSTCDISLNDGFGHYIGYNFISGTSVGARGLCTAMPVGAATQLNQLTLEGNQFSAHTVQDVTIGANQKTGIILPQATNNYTYTDNSGHVIKLDINQFGIMNFTGVEFAPSADGTTASGDAATGWSTVFTYSTQLKELTAPSAAVNRDICYGDSTAHAIECSYNNGSFFRMQQYITATSAAFATATTAGTCVQNTTAVTGATTSMTVEVSPVSTPGVGAEWSAFVSSAGHVTINECAVAASAGGTIAFNIRVHP